jgi:predicted DNA-binding protein
MTLTIDLNTELEDRLKREAERRGLEPKAYARQLIEAGLTVDPKHSGAPTRRRSNC